MEDKEGIRQIVELNGAKFYQWIIGKRRNGLSFVSG